MSAVLLLFLRKNWMPIALASGTLLGVGAIYLKGRSDASATADAKSTTAIIKRLKERNATDAKVETMSDPKLCRAIGGVWRDNRCE